MSDYKSIKTEELIKIANAIRYKTGNRDKISLEAMAKEIREIEGGVSLPELENEGAAADLLSGKELIDSEGNIVTGTIPIRTNNNLSVNGANVTVPKGYYNTDVVAKVSSATQATPSVNVDANGLITASATQTAGYVSAGTKTATKQLTTQEAKTVTPSKSSQTAVASGVYTTGAVTVAAIPSQYITTTDATASASDILSGKTAYVNGEKVTGTIATKTASDLTTSGATVTVPAGYYATQASKSVATATRAETIMTTTADDTNDKLTITASNNQSTGYVTGANKTATTTVTLTASGATVTASDGSKSISKSVATATQATPSVSVNSSGLITATATQTAGYVSAGSKSGTKQLTTQAAKTITPSKSSQTAVAKDVYTTGVVTVAAIPSQYITTTDATAAAGEIFSGETAYVNGSKVTGTFSIDNELSNQDNLISQIQTALQNKATATGEDVTSEINAYTTKLATLETAITQLETELQGKASGGSGGGVVKTYTLKVESDGKTKLRFLEYIAYENNEYKFYFNSFNNSAEQYPLYIENIVLNTPINVYTIGGLTPCVDLVSNIKYAVYTNTVGGISGDLYDTGRLLPLEADANGQIIIRCYNDD